MQRQKQRSQSTCESLRTSFPKSCLTPCQNRNHGTMPSSWSLGQNPPTARSTSCCPGCRWNSMHSSRRISTPEGSAHQNHPWHLWSSSSRRRMAYPYQALNAVTIKNWYPILLISKLIVQLHGAKYFTKLDVCWGFNNMWICDRDEWKATFCTNCGLFEPQVMFFGLTNSPPNNDEQHLLRHDSRRGHLHLPR